MKGGFIALIVIGSVLLTVGAFFAIGAINTSRDRTITKEYNVEQYSKMNIDIQTADLEFKVSTNGERKVVCVEKKKLYHDVKVENDTLTIKSINTRKWYENILNFNWNRMSITVYAPAEAYGDSIIKSSTGNITIPSDFSFENLNAGLSTGNVSIKSNVIDYANVRTSTGNISLEMKPKNLDVRASTGNVKLNKVEVEEKLTINTSTGHIQLTDVKAKDMELRASTGTVKLTNTIADGNMIIRTSTGDVTFNDSDASVLIDVETSTGDVKGTLLTGKIFQFITSTGSIKPVESVAGSGTCKVKTSTGDIALSVKA